jgi:hypothetical protein
VERVFLAVPLSYLDLDPDTSRNEPKVPPEDLRKAMATVPELYRMQLNETTDADFRRMCENPTSERERLLGTTYRHLFSPSPSAQPLRAEFYDGRGLLVTAGQHRVIEAQRLGVPYLPMHVTVPDRIHLDRIREACDGEVRDLTPDLSDVPKLQRLHDERFYPNRDRHRVLERHPGPERLEPEREIGWRLPERER